jgi:hypothetical protein
LIRPVRESLRAEIASPLFETFDDNQTSRYLIGAQQLTRRGSEHPKAEPRQFILGEVTIAPMASFGLIVCLWE